MRRRFWRAVFARLEPLRERVDQVAAEWLMARVDLSRPLLITVLEQLAARASAKLEYSELP